VDLRGLSIAGQTLLAEPPYPDTLGGVKAEAEQAGKMYALPLMPVSPASVVAQLPSSWFRRM
jgi:hypothetical protein